MIKNYKISIEYDGTNFVGWQRQSNGRSVQAEIEDALQQITSQNVTVIGSGRTDAGVHAKEQVANFFLESTFVKEDVLRSINGLTGDDILVHSIEEVDEKFSARYSAKEREYTYYISLTPTVFQRKYSLYVGYKLDVPLMNGIISTILGSHDFQSFCRAEANTQHYMCSVFEACWHHSTKDKLRFVIRANRFLHGMVRALVGTCINVGRGFTSQQEFVAIMKSKNRSNAGPSVPPHGLFLERVIY